MDFGLFLVIERWVIVVYWDYERQICVEVYR